MRTYSDVCTTCGRTVTPAETVSYCCHRCSGTSFIQCDLGDATQRTRREKIEETWKAQQEQGVAAPPAKKEGHRVFALCALFGVAAAILTYLFYRTLNHYGLNTIAMVAPAVTMFLTGVAAGKIMIWEPLRQMVTGVITLLLSFLIAMILIMGTFGL